MQATASTKQRPVAPLVPEPLKETLPVHVVMTGLALLACVEQQRLLIGYDGSIHYEDRNLQSVRRYLADDGAQTLVKAIATIWQSALVYIEKDHANAPNLHNLMPSALNGLQQQVTLYLKESEQVMWYLKEGKSKPCHLHLWLYPSLYVQ
jgi:hypothetical protein